MSGYEVSICVLVGIVSLASLPLFVTSCFLIPHKEDTARRGFFWLKSALLLLFLGGILYTIPYIFFLLLYHDAVDFTPKKYEAMDRLSIWAFLFLQLCSISTFLSLVDLSFGILYCLDRLPRARPISQWVSYGFGFILAVFTFTIFVKYESYNARYYRNLWDSDYSRNSHRGELRPFQLLVAATDIPLGVAHLAELALSIFVIAASRKALKHGKIALLLLVASIFAFIQAVWKLAAVAAWTIPYTYMQGPYVIILTLVFEFIFLFVALVILFAAGVKKVGGLWSTHHDVDSPILNDEAYRV